MDLTSRKGQVLIELILIAFLIMAIIGCFSDVTHVFAESTKLSRFPSAHQLWKGN
jgi:hypothetical protein